MNSQLQKQLQICLLLVLVSLALVIVQANVPTIAKPGCKDTCGTVKIPYPFGIGTNCFLDEWFEIECKPSTNSSKPFLSKLNIEVMEIFINDDYNVNERSLVVKMPVMTACDSASRLPRSSLNLTEGPFSFSALDNVLVMEGCPGNALVFLDGSNEITAGCGTVCHDYSGVIPESSCFGVHCCQTTLKPDVYFHSFYEIEFNRQGLSRESRDCLVASLMKSDSVNEYAGKISNTDSLSTFVPVVLLWRWISTLEADNDSHEICTRELYYSSSTMVLKSLVCRCKVNHYGNPYVSNGCQVPEDCKGCRSYCSPLSGIPDAYHCRDKLPLDLAAILGLSISFGTILLAIGIYGLYRIIKRRREMKRRAKFFKRNGGLLLQQQLSSNEGVLEKTKIFTSAELDKATDNFNDNRILGQGGQGTVYKGMLIDGRIVAIKKAKLLDESQLVQFINEVIILSQINHRNVVRMLGCCLETEVPLLVYEYIPNGTLSQHIHDPEEDFVISWEILLKIAYDSAAAIAYLHSSSSIPIFHRDIKSPNILLDEKHRAKVSDFGSSKTIAIDQTHLTTLVQGTLGYLDPEYFQSYQFTEKSDVYSFGVVLLEILTGKKPIYRDASTMEQKNLVTEFLFLMQNSKLSNILDPEIVKQAKEEELSAIVDLAKCCISRSGKERPTMKEVAMTLEMIIKSPAQASSCYKQAFRATNDGFTENAIAEASDAEFTSSPLPASAYNPLYIHVPDTI